MFDERLQQIKQLETQLGQPGGAERVATDFLSLADQILFDYDSVNAYRLGSVIKNLLSKSEESLSKSVAEKLNKLLVRLKFLSLSYWPESEILNLFEHGLGQVLDDDYVSVAERLYELLIETPVHLRDELKRKILHRIRENKEIISSKTINLDNEAGPASVQNILRDFLGSQIREIGTVSIAEYFMGSTYRKFNDREKNKIQVLLKLVDRLNKSSLRPEGHENVILFSDATGTMKVLDGGIVSNLEDIETTTSPVSQPAIKPQLEVSARPSSEQDILQAYQGDAAQQQAIQKEQDRLTKKVDNNVAKLRDAFYKAVQSKNLAATVAALRLMADSNQLEPFLAEDNRLKKFLKATWQKQYGQDLVAEFESRPDQVKFVRLFLQYILEQRLGMLSNEAARIGMQIGNILVRQGKTEYNKMAYFDVPTKKFKWFT
jgi:hypothetical protein